MRTRLNTRRRGLLAAPGSPGNKVGDVSFAAEEAR
jgi:hypothetical protein